MQFLQHPPHLLNQEPVFTALDAPVALTLHTRFLPSEPPCKMNAGAPDTDILRQLAWMQQVLNTPKVIHVAKD